MIVLLIYSIILKIGAKLEQVSELESEIQYWKAVDVYSSYLTIFLIIYLFNELSQSFMISGHYQGKLVIRSDIWP